MKKQNYQAIAAIIVMIFISSNLHAQFTTSSGVTSTNDQVGIGTSTPTDLFSIKNGDMSINKTNDFANIFGRSNNYGLTIAANTTGSNGAAIQLFGAGSSPSGSVIFYSPGTSGTGYNFLNWDGTNFNELFQIKRDGTVQIGTMGTNSALTVTGDISLYLPNDATERNILGRTSSSSLTIASNTNPSNGSCIQLNGVGTNMANAGSVTFYSTNATNGDIAFDYVNYVGNGNYSGIMRMRKDGKVIIGGGILNNYPGNYNLYVQNGILTEKIKVALSTDYTNWSDFVFAKDYKLMPLNKVESYLKENKHLPEIPSATEVAKDGIDLAAMDAKLLQKIEELTLYIIQQQKEINALKERKN